MFHLRLLALFLVSSLLCLAATLPPAALLQWQAYTGSAGKELSSRASLGKPFLRSDDRPELRAKVLAGEVATTELDLNLNKHLPSALIHHWVGAIFIPRVSMDEVILVLRDYPNYKQMYRPTVQESARTEAKSLLAGTTKSGTTKDGYRSIMAYKSYLLKTAFQTDYEVSYSKLNAQAGFSLMRTTRVQEIDEFGSPSQHMLPEGQGSGIIWSLYGVTRFVERDGGVVLEVEALGLSRGIPMGLRWMVQPMIRRVLSESLTISLRQTKESIEAHARERVASQNAGH